MAENQIRQRTFRMKLRFSARKVYHPEALSYDAAAMSHVIGALSGCPCCVLASINMSKMLKSSGAMGAATLLSRILGLVREMTYARFMGSLPDPWPTGGRT